MGCGWLGLPLAKYLVANSYSVHGTTTSNEKLLLLGKEDIVPHQITLSSNAIGGDIQSLLSQIDILIINIPPKLRSGNSESFYEKVKLVYIEIKKSSVSHIIFISSTAVYGEIKGEVTEDCMPKPITESGKQLFAAEQLFKKDDELPSTVIRFGGLIGPDRHPVTMLSKRQNLVNGYDPINLIHLNDCIHMISTIIKNDYWGEIFNGVYPFHPTKKEFYIKEALKMGLPPPDYSKSLPSKLNKVIVSKNFLDKSHHFETPVGL